MPRVKGKQFIENLTITAVLSLLFIGISTPSSAHHIDEDFLTGKAFYTDVTTSPFFDVVTYEELRKKKVNTAILAVLLGPFGVHRLYLGTDAKVPVIYTITLGGGFGILPIIDMITVLTSKDVTRYEDNDRVIMWNQ